MGSPASSEFSVATSTKVTGPAVVDVSEVGGVQTCMNRLFKCPQPDLCTCAMTLRCIGSWGWAGRSWAGAVLELKLGTGPGGTWAQDR